MSNHEGLLCLTVENLHITNMLLCTLVSQIAKDDNARQIGLEIMKMIDDSTNRYGAILNRMNKEETE